MVLNAATDKIVVRSVPPVQGLCQNARCFLEESAVRAGERLLRDDALRTNVAIVRHRLIV